MYYRRLETDKDAKAAHDREQKASAAARLKALADREQKASAAARLKALAERNKRSK